MNEREMTEGQVANPPSDRPVMVFDADCGFCRFWIERWRVRTRGRVDYEPFQKVAGNYPEIPRSAFESAVRLIEPSGRVTSGADAVFRALRRYGKENRMLTAVLAVPGLRAASRIVYRVIARHRTAASFLTRWLFGKNPLPPTYLFARWLFLKLLGVAFLIAFVSLLLQIRGLIGKRGILPAAEFLDAGRGQIGIGRCWLMPTLCWIDATDPFLIFLCGTGAAISCALILGLAPGASLILLWALYLSLVTIGRTFLGFQWDALLLETAFLAIFLTPLQLWPDWKTESRGSRIARWLMLWLLLRLMFESGVVKLASGDETWRNLTALSYHFETQPLPLWTSWYANQAPLWLQKSGCFAMFAIELAAPFCIFGPRNVRRAGCMAMIALQLLIAGTGNYCFFNLLAIALCLPLLDDDVWPSRWREKLLTGTPARGLEWWPWILGPVAAASMILSAVQLAAAFRMRVRWPGPVLDLYRAISPFCTSNQYGLFAVMTTSRPEIIVEGSNDGVTWLPYEFKWKPGALDRRPRIVAPFQPRLDWQMWFAALGSYEENPWFTNFLSRLLQGSPEVLGLLASNPFPDAPPRYVRAVLYDYHFSRFGDDPALWWKRDYKGLYHPPISLRARADGN